MCALSLARYLRRLRLADCECDIEALSTEIADRFSDDVASYCCCLSQMPRLSSYSLARSIQRRLLPCDGSVPVEPADRVHVLRDEIADFRIDAVRRIRNAQHCCGNMAKFERAVELFSF